jgi:hypothetical protein
MKMSFGWLVADRHVMLGSGRETREFEEGLVRGR